ncbi:hypothetical protein TNCV_2389571 [Trichonephila clavipes]|nr:hypothetical protein TNCV_2389571 [Trichonephila clavipes]
MPLEKEISDILTSGVKFPHILRLQFEPSIVEDSPCRGDRCTLNLSRLKCPPVDMMRKLGREVPPQVSSSSLDHDSKLRAPSPIALG